MAKATCSVDGCRNPVIARGWCPKHYQANRQAGTFTPRPKGQPFPVNLLRSLVFLPAPEPYVCPNGTTITTGCIETTKVNADGYGRLWVNGSNQLAHRALHELLIGPIPDGFQLDHLCRNRACVRLSHLEPVTPVVNVRRGETGKHMAVRTHCPQGHEYTAENTRLSGGSRSCRECGRIGERARRARRDAAAR